MSTRPSLQPALPKQMYIDQAHWAVERDRVLHATWFCVGRVDALSLDRPSTLAVVDVVGESVLLTSDRDGRLHAAYNVCRHRGAQLVSADPGSEPPAPCAVGSLRCPYHSWTYDLDGRLLKAPHTPGVEGFDPARFSLHPVAVDRWGGFVFVHLTPERAGSLMDEIGEQVAGIERYPLDELLVGRRFDYDIAANYKVLSENYNECYHCGPVHPELTRLVPSFGGGGAGLDWDAGVEHREGAWTFTLSGTTRRRPFDGLDTDERTRHKGALLHPNLWLSCSADHVAAFTLWPLGVDRTRVVCDLLFAPDEVASPDFDPDDAADFWDLVNRQDWAVCESVQRGMSSRAYREGWFAPMEDLAADVRRWLLPRLEEQER
ncbi:MAG: aromatic ring-hydroxylating oxygenase subunit alpha [Nocardioidaceae bacterium]